MPADAERDPIEWAQHSALVAISVARTVLDLVEAAVTDRDRLERLASSGRSFAESWLGDAARLAGAMTSGFSVAPDAPPDPARPPTASAGRATAAAAAPGAATKRTTRAPAKKAPATKRTERAPAKKAPAKRRALEAKKAAARRPTRS